MDTPVVVNKDTRTVLKCADCDTFSTTSPLAYSRHIVSVHDVAEVHLKQNADEPAKTNGNNEDSYVPGTPRSGGCSSPDLVIMEDYNDEEIRQIMKTAPIPREVKIPLSPVRAPKRTQPKKRNNNGIRPLTMRSESVHCGPKRPRCNFSIMDLYNLGVSTINYKVWEECPGCAEKSAWHPLVPYDDEEKRKAKSPHTDKYACNWPVEFFMQAPTKTLRYEMNPFLCQTAAENCALYYCKFCGVDIGKHARLV